VVDEEGKSPMANSKKEDYAHPLIQRLEAIVP